MRILNEKIKLTPFTERSLDKLIEWLDDDEITKNLLLTSIIEIKKDRFLWLNRKIICETEQCFSVETLEGNLIGKVEVNDISYLNKSAEISILIGEKSYWGQGYAKKTIKALCYYIFEYLQFHKVYLRVYEFNINAIALYLSCGFVVEGNFRDHILRDGRYYNCYRMSLLESEYKTLKEDGNYCLIELKE